MKKLKLNLDDLKIESFVTTPEVSHREKGTVFGHAHTCEEPTCDNGPSCDLVTCYGTCNDPTCNGGHTCQDTCAGFTCDLSCARTCYGTSCEA